MLGYQLYYTKIERKKIGKRHSSMYMCTCLSLCGLAIKTIQFMQVQSTTLVIRCISSVVYLMVNSELILSIPVSAGLVLAASSLSFPSIPPNKSRVHVGGKWVRVYITISAHQPWHWAFQLRSNVFSSVSLIP